MTLSPNPTLSHDELTVQLIEQILEQLHPVVAEGLLLAAVPYSYDLELLAALRVREDGKDEKMIGRLYEFSFVSLEMSQRRYRLEQLHRHILQTEFIRRDRAGYLAAQERALAYWRDHPAADPVVQAQNLLYHGLLADSESASFDRVESRTLLLESFRTFANDRQLAAIERLLRAAAAARVYLALLNTPWLGAYDELLAYLQARYSQMRGRWSESRETLAQLLGQVTLWPPLFPFVARAYGHALAHSGDFVGAIAQYKIALDRFKEQIQNAAGDPAAAGPLEAERGATMIALGDAHAGLAQAARGQLETLRDQRLWVKARDWLATLAALPMVIYLSFYLGLRVWHPRFWTALRGEDWLIARLFALSAHWYHRADPLLERHGALAEAVAADERLAYLYLELGDAYQAAAQFERLLAEEEAPLGDYRRATVQLGLAEANLQQNKPGRSRYLLEEALPILERFEDETLLPRARALWGETLLAVENIDPALAAFKAALDGYEESGNRVAATEIVDRLARLEQDQETGSAAVRLDDAGRRALRPLLARLAEYHYPIRFIHPFLRWLRAALLLSLAAALLFIPVVVLRFQVFSGLMPAIAFRPAPLLDLDAPFVANLSQTLQEGAAAQAEIAVSADSVLYLALIIAVGYVLLTLAVGLALIVLTPLSSVQKRSEQGLVRLTPDEIAVGRQGEGSRLSWPELDKIVLADVRFWPTTPMNGSALLLTGGRGQRLIVRGTTRRYGILRERILAHRPDTAALVDRDYVAWRSGWLWLYVLGLLVVWPLMLLTEFSADFVWRDLFYIYSIADLYPYLYLLMFLPVCWWVIGRTSWQLILTEPQSRWPWVLLACALLLTGYQIGSRFRDLFTVPDIYPPLFTLFLLAAAVWFTLRAGQMGRAEGRNRFQDLLLVLLAVAAGGVMIARLARDVAGYHYLVVGRYWNTQAVERRQLEQPAGELFDMALVNYGRAQAIMEWRIAGIRGFQAVRRQGIGVPRTEDHIWLQALKDKAMLNAQKGNYAEAIADFERLLPYAEKPADVHAWLAVAHQSRRSETAQSFTFFVEQENYLLALDEYTAAIELEPGRADFYLWRGVTRHALDRLQAAEQDYKSALAVDDRQRSAEMTPLDARSQAQALTGWGWILWSEDDIGRALIRFTEATEADPTYGDGYLGVGYALYRLRGYEAAEQALLQAAELAPDDPLPLVALGTVNWRLGTLAHDPEGGGREVCGMEEASTTAKEEARRRWMRSVDFFTQATTLSLQNPADIAYTFRTRGQVEYLLRDCPGLDKDDQYRAAVDSYTQALRYAPEEDLYWQLRARLRYALWLRTPQAAANDHYLYDAWRDIAAAAALDPDEPNTARYVDVLAREIVTMVGPEAWAAYLAAAEQGALDGRVPVDFGCAYNTRFVADVTIPDDTLFEPGEPFEKIWRIRNSGTCPWTGETRWVFVAGERMGAPDWVPLPPAERGEEVDVAVNFSAPRAPGTYQSDWALRPAGQEPLAKSYYVRIVVPPRE